jgi:hypothetical protein
MISVVFDVLPIVFPTFYLFDLLIRKLEADNCSFSNVILIYRSFIEILKTRIPLYSLNEGNPFIMDFLYFFDERVNSTADYRLLYLISSFLPAGRQHLRNLMGVFESEPFDSLDQLPHDDTLFFNVPENFDSSMELFKSNIVLNSDAVKMAIMNLYDNNSVIYSSEETTDHLSYNSTSENDLSTQEDLHKQQNDISYNNNPDEDVSNIQHENQIQEEYLIDESTLHGRASRNRCEASLSSSDEEGMYDLVLESDPLNDPVNLTKDEQQNNEEGENDEENSSDDAEFNSEIDEILVHDINEQADPTVLIHGDYNIHELLNW